MNKQKILALALIITITTSIMSGAVLLNMAGAATRSYNITLDTINGVPAIPGNAYTNPVHLEGTADATNFVGQVNQYHVRIDWGDGTINPSSIENFVSTNGDDFSGTWSSSPNHIYTSSGSYSISVKLYHSQPPGQSGTIVAVFTATFAVTVSKLEYTAGASQTLAADVLSQQITVQRQDDAGNPITSCTTTVDLTTTSTAGIFYSDAGTTTTNSVSINPGSSTASFWYKDTQAGTPTITASATNLSPAITTFTITANPAAASVVISPASASIVAGGSQVYSAEAFDGFGNSLGVVTGSTVFSCPGASVVGSSVSATVVGSYTVTGTYMGLTDTASLTVTVGTIIDHFSFAPISSPQTTGTSFTITITAQDPYGNTVTAYTGTNTLTYSAGAIAPAITTAFVDGVWTGPVILFSTGPEGTISTAGAQAIGTSNAFEVVAGTLIITATADTGGSISPSGDVVVNFGSDQSFTITASPGYQIADILVDGSSAGAVETYTFLNVQTSHTIQAFFLQQQGIGIIAAAGPGGSIIPYGYIPVTVGDTVSFTITPNDHYYIANVYIDGTPIGPVSSYTFSNIQGSRTIYAAFAMETLTIQATADANGQINPSGSIPVAYGSDKTFIITPNAQHRIANVYVDGNSIGSVSSYTFTNVISDHTIRAEFAPNTYTITVISPHGFPTPSSTVNAGSNFLASVTSPDGGIGHRWVCTGYSIDGGASIGGTSYTFVNVQADHTITFNWQEQFYLTVQSAQSAQTSGTGWYNAGTTAVATVTSGTISAGNGIQHLFTGWSGDATGTATTSNAVTMNSAKTATANWKTQYYLTVNSEYGTPTGQGWYDAGATANLYIETSVAAQTNTRYGFAGWTGTGTGAYTGTSAVQAITVNSPIAETASWNTQYQVTYVTSGNAVSINTPTAQWITAGQTATGTFPATATNSANDIRSAFVSDNRPTTITQPTLITGTYQNQYLVTYAAAGNELQIALPDSEWVSSGQAAIGTFPASATNTANDIRCTLLSNDMPATITAPTLITGTYQTQFLVNYAIIGTTLSINAPNSEWVNSGAAATGTFTQQVTNEAGDIRNNLVNDNRPTTISNPTTITANYQTQYKVTFSQTGMEQDATGTILTVSGETKDINQLPYETWINSGNSVEFAYSGTVTTSAIEKHYDLTEVSANSPITMNEPAQIQATYTPQFSTSLYNVIGAILLLLLLMLILILLLAWRRRRKKEEEKSSSINA